MPPLPINSTVPKLVDVPAGVPWYSLAGVSDEGAHSRLIAYPSPYGAHNGTSQFRAILARQADGDYVALLVKPSAVHDPATDCEAAVELELSLAATRAAAAVIAR